MNVFFSRCSDLPKTKHSHAKERFLYERHPLQWKCGKNYATCMGIWEGVLMFLYLSHFITFVSSWMIMIACSDSQNQASKLNQLQMTNHCGNHNSSHIYHKDKVITNIDPWNKEFHWLHGKNVSRHSSVFLFFTKSFLHKEHHRFADKTSFFKM